ncbi:hypothetical protein AOLI_G00313240 [Acnodon oligacanthus]
MLPHAWSHSTSTSAAYSRPCCACGSACRSEHPGIKDDHFCPSAHPQRGLAQSDCAKVSPANRCSPPLPQRSAVLRVDGASRLNGGENF